MFVVSPKGRVREVRAQDKKPDETEIPMWVAQMPARAMKVYYKRMRTEAVAAFCTQCMGGNRAEVKRCVSYGCPLWPYRPWQPKGQLPPGAPSKDMLAKMIAHKRERDAQVRQARQSDADAAPAPKTRERIVIRKRR